MFRYKGTVGVAGLTHPDSTDKRLSSGSSYSSRGSMDPGRDSWVFTKDVPQKYHTSKRHHHKQHALDNISYSIREESLSPSLTEEDVIKLNELYNGGVYRVKGFRIICSVLTGIVLLLTALVILGVWIILGAKENGEMYFPWNEIENSTLHSVKSDNKKLGGFLMNINYERPSPVEREVTYVRTSQETAESVGHFQAINPKRLEDFDVMMTSAEYDQYNMEYEEYYNDLLEEYSLLHPTVVKPPPDFVDNTYEYYDEEHENYQQMSGQASNVVITPVEAPRRPEKFTPSERLTDDEVIALRRKQNRLREIQQEQVARRKPKPTLVPDSKKPNSELPRASREQDLNVVEEVVENDVALNDESLETLTTSFQNSNPKQEIPRTEVPKLIFTNLDLLDRQRESAVLPTNKFERDPHRELFRKSYTSDEIILDHLFGHQLRRRNLRLADVQEMELARNSAAQQQPAGESLVKTSRAFSPVPDVRRSQISSGNVRPKLNPDQREYLRIKQRQSTQPPQVVSENLPRFQVKQRDGSLIRNPGLSPMLRRPIDRMHNSFQPWVRRSTVPGPLNPAFRVPHRQMIPPRPPSSFQMRSSPSNAQALVQHRRTKPAPKEGGFVNALNRMFNYSKNIASTLMKFPDRSDATTLRTSVDFLKNSFGLLSNYDHVFSNLPQVFMDPLNKFQLPSSDQLDQLNPFQISLITWTFIDFWEFLIEKVGTLSREDIRTLEFRLSTIRQAKDNRVAKSLFEAEANITSSMEDSDYLQELDRIMNIGSPNNASSSMDGEVNIQHNLVEEDRTKFMKFSVKTLLKFGRVYLESDYALDCMMLLFCKDMNSNTERPGMGGVAAKLKRYGSNPVRIFGIRTF